MHCRISHRRTCDPCDITMEIIIGFGATLKVGGVHNASEASTREGVGGGSIYWLPCTLWTAALLSKVFSHMHFVNVTIIHTGTF